MSHIQSFNQENQSRLALNAPWYSYQKRYKTVDFLRTMDAMGAPDMFSARERPKPKKLNFELDLVASMEEERFKVEDALKDITNVSWKVYSVSPMFNYGPQDLSEEKSQEILKDLEELLESHLDSKLQGCHVNEDTMDEKSFWQVKVNEVKGLRGHCDDSQGLKIQVFAPRNTKNHEKEIVLTSYLISVGSHEVSGLDYKILEKMRILPCCLLKGDERVTNVVCNALETKYDCKIYPVIFDQENLRWMSAMWMGFSLEEGEKEGENLQNERDVEKEDREVSMRYRVTKKCGIEEFRMDFKEKFSLEFSNSFYSGESEEITEETVEDFHCLLNQQFKKSFGINVDKLTLDRIKLSSIHAERSGIIRIQRWDKVKTVLSYVTEKCQGSMRTPVPEIAAEENLMYLH